MSVGPELLVETEAAVAGAEIVPLDVEARSPFELFWRRFRQDRLAVASLV